MHFTCLTFLLSSEKKCELCNAKLAWGRFCQECKKKCIGCGEHQEKGAYSRGQWQKPTPRCIACDENAKRKCFGCGALQGKGAYHYAEWLKPTPRCIACLGE